MSIAMEGRLRLLERRVAELERRLQSERRPEPAPPEQGKTAEAPARKPSRKPPQKGKSR